MDSFEQVEKAADPQMIRLFIKDCWKTGKGTGWLFYYDHSTLDGIWRTDLLWGVK